MLEVGKVVVEPMDDNRAVLNLSRMVPVRGGSADGDCKPESEETDAGHQDEDDANESHFLTPGTLLLAAVDACWTGVNLRNMLKVPWTYHRNAVTQEGYNRSIANNISSSHS